MDELITVYMPTYNRLGMLQRAVGSVLSQSYQNFELIIVDDNSKDGTAEYLKTLTAQNPKIKIYLKDQNTGACVSRNIAIKMASGKYITGLDDDDYFHPNRLEILLKKYDPKYSLICANWIDIIDKQQSVNSIISRKIKLNDLYWGNAIGNQAFTETKRVLAVGGYDESLKASQDLDLWLRLVKKYGTAKRIRQALYYFDQSHELGRISASDNRIIGTEQIIAKYGHEMSAQQKRFKIDKHGSGLEACLANRSGKNLFQKIILDLNLYGYRLFIEKVRAKLKIS